MAVTASTDRLVYVTGGELGLRRAGRAGAFVIVDEDGEPITDEETLERVRTLRIPPAWTDVWIATAANAYLQATGHDSKGRPYSAKEFRTWSATVLAAVALAREHEAGHRGPRAVSRAVREVSVALGNTPSVARASYIDPRVITSFEDDLVIEVPEDGSPGTVQMRIEGAGDDIVLELPTDVDEDAVRVDVERRVCELLARPPGDPGRRR